MTTPATEIDVRQELDEAPTTRFHWRLCAFAFTAIVFDGYDTLIPAYTIPYVAQPWGLSQVQAGLLISTGLMGFLVGSLLNGVFADRFGRRPTLIVGLFIAGVFSLLTGLFADSFGTFAGLRVLTGIGLGVIMPLGIAYINENAPRRTRNRLAVVAGVGFAVGGVLSSLIGAVLTPIFGWQILYLIGSGPVLLGVLYLVVFPDSVEFLVVHGRQREAARLLARIRPERVDLYRTSRLVARSRASTGKDWQVPLRATYLRRTIALWAAAFCLLFCIYAVSGWLPTLMIERGHSFAAGIAFAAILQCCAGFGGLVAGYVADRRAGARHSLILWCGLGAVAALMLAVVDTTPTNIIGVAAAGFFIIGGQHMLNNLCAGTYPVIARGAGQGYMLGIGRLGGIVGPLLAGVLLSVFGVTSAVFVAIAMAAALGAASAVLARGDAALVDGRLPAPQDGQRENSPEGPM